MKSLAMKFLLMSLAVSAFTVRAASAATQQELEAYANEAVKKLYADSPAAQELAGQAQGMLVFPRVWKGGIGLGAEAGEGVLRIRGRTADYYLLTGGSFGLQLGLQRRSVVVLFMDGQALAKFRDSEGWKAGVDGSIAIASLGAESNLDTNTSQKPMIGFVFSNKGLMYNLSLEGTKLTKIKK
jgi:lipid-binding SYLF domain-containing protein